MKIILIMCFLVVCLSHMQPAYADYVLPYPSFMPGSPFYKISNVLDSLKNYWSWGNVAQTKYRMSLADKYLVEAKTLFEYRQYLLGAKALTQSDQEFSKITTYLIGAKLEGVDISNLVATVRDEARVHSSVLNSLAREVPQTFTWAPEKAKPTDIRLQKMLETSESIREQVASQAGVL